ncbi:hypothetical protein MXB_4159 [Myxobolus squamalis]|nr:hypothetical protein MXB_4159 [Myxobolus squamalis]
MYFLRYSNKLLNQCYIIVIKYWLEIILVSLALVATRIYNPFTRKTMNDFAPLFMNPPVSSKSLPIRTPKILCLCLTYPSKEKLVESVLKTWGPKCDKLIFATKPLLLDVPTIPVNISKESRGNLWNKIRQSFIYIHDNYIDEYEWFIKTDDDTYVIFENLRYFLSQYNSDEPYYFGK